MQNKLKNTKRRELWKKAKTIKVVNFSATLLFMFIFILSFSQVSAFNFNENDVVIVGPLEDNGAIPVNIQDQTTPPILVYMNQVQGTAVLTANFTINSYNITINDSTGITVGDYVGVFSKEYNMFYTGNVLAVNGLIVTMDTPSDFNFTIGDIFQCGIKEMNVDGSITPQIFSLRADPNLDITVDVTRIIIHITDNVVMDDEKFGGLTKLNRGIVLRRKDGTYQNLFNVKTNGEFGELAFDKTYDFKAPAGFYGFTSRLTFAGSNKMGVAIRLGQDEDLQLIIQDDLTDLNTFRIMVEGHVVTD